MGGCFERHRHEEFLKFLRQIDRETPPERQLHLVVDNYATHKHPKVQTWLKRHPRFHLHFTPTSSSWLNLVERWFGEITRKRIRRGSFKSVKDLIEVIQDYIRHNNQDPKPFVWIKRIDQILEKVGHSIAPPTVHPYGADRKTRETCGSCK
jgi:transposase